MGNWFKDLILGNSIDNQPQTLNEQIEAFRPKRQRAVEKRSRQGEGMEDMDFILSGNYSSLGFNSFYKTYVNKTYEDEVARIKAYREMAQYPEIADVIEDATMESTQENYDGDIIYLEILDETLNDNATKNIRTEFKELFHRSIRIKWEMWNLMYNYFVDGKVFWEKIVDTSKPKRGIIGIKRLPSETMDFMYDPVTGAITAYFQYLTTKPRQLPSIEDAMKDPNVVVFYPDQISMVHYGYKGATKREFLGYLEKAKQPYNNLRLLETSVVIYRLIRAPERFVFKIDTGNMPKDKAMKYVDKVKTMFQKKQTYDASSGNLTNEPDMFCIRKNTEIPLLDGRYLTLEEIIKEHNEGKENWVYSINQETHNVEPGKITHAKLTRLNEKLVRVYTDNGDYIDTTYDHKFILRDGTECEASKLQIGQSLMPLYSKDCMISPKVKEKYQKIYNPASNRYEFTHRIVSNITNGIQQKGQVVHHKNFNRYDNSPSNLQLMGSYDYTKMYRELIIKRFEDPEYRERHREWVIRTNIEQNKVLKMREILNQPEIRERQKEAVRQSKTEWFQNEENRNNFKQKKSMILDETSIQMMCDKFISLGKPRRDDLLKSLSEDKSFMGHLERINEHQIINNKQFNHFNKQNLWRMIETLGFNDYVDFRSNYEGYKNHKVVSLEFLEERDDTGCITVEGNHNFAVSRHHKPLFFISNSILENFFLPQSADGRGSDVTSVGGNPSGFAELDDLYYFQKKLYKSLKYPMSRVSSLQERAEKDILFNSGQMGEITRDEIKWAKFLERQQARFGDEFVKMFLFHLDLKGLKQQYNLDEDSFRIVMTSPNQYRDHMRQGLLETNFSNYNALASNEEFSKYYLMKKYLGWNDDDIKANAEGFKKDKELLPDDAGSNMF